MTFTIRASHDDVADLAARLNDYIYDWNKFEYADNLCPATFYTHEKGSDEIFVDFLIYNPFELIHVLNGFVWFASEESSKEVFQDFINDITELYF